MHIEESQEIELEEKNVIFFHEGVVEYFADIFPYLAHQIYVDRDLDALFESAQLVQMMLRRVVWYYKNILDDDIIGIKFVLDKENFLRVFLICSNGVFIGLGIPWLDKIASMIIPEQKLRVGEIFLWEDIIKERGDQYIDDEEEE